MKTIVKSLIAILFVVPAMADTQSERDPQILDPRPQVGMNVVGVHPIEGRVVSIERFQRPFSCPPGLFCAQVMPAPQFKITLAFDLHGCADKLAPVQYYSHESRWEDGKLNVIVSAMNISNELSTRIMCFAMPTETVEIYVDDFSNMTPEDITVLFLNNQDTAQTL